MIPSHSPPNSSFPASSSQDKTLTGLAVSEEDALVASWGEILARLLADIDSIGRGQGSDTIPEIDFQELRSNHPTIEHFSTQAKSRGVAVVRNVIREGLIQAWMGETEQYLSHNNASLETAERRLAGNSGDDIWWSPVQVKTKAHPALLETQRLLMELWQSSDPSGVALTTHFPIACARQLFLSAPGEALYTIREPACSQAVNDLAAAGVESSLEEIQRESGKQHDSWDSSALFRSDEDAHQLESVVKNPLTMFHGLLSINDWPSGCGPMKFLPLLRLSRKYLQLRPLFRPKHHSSVASGFLQPDNWTLEAHDQIDEPPLRMNHIGELQQCLIQSGASLSQTPVLRPVDYLVWHRGVLRVPIPAAERVMAASIPICPLTRRNSRYLAQQRKAFLLGHSVGSQGGRRGIETRDEAGFMGRPGVQEVSDVGGDRALRAMGLLPWDEDDAETEAEADVLEAANNVLFPD